MEFIGRHRVVVVVLLLVVGLVVVGTFSTPKRSYTFSSDVINNSGEASKPFSLGDEEAPVHIIQYSDFLCPSCSQVSLGIMPKVVENYVDSGKAYLEFRVMSFIASGSQTSAEGAYCAADQDKFWPYHDGAYTAVWNGYFSKGISPYSVDLYSVDGVKSIAKDAGLDQDKFDSCLDSHSTRQAVISATKSYQQNGVNSTPYIVVNDVPINGVPTYEMIEAAIKAGL